MIPIAFITPSEQRNQAGTIPLTQSGAVRVVDFDGGQGFFIEEGTVNLIPDPTMDNLSLWQVVRGTLAPIEGENFIRLIRSADISNTARIEIAVPAEFGQIYTAQVRFRPVTPGLKVGLNIQALDDNAYLAPNIRTASIAAVSMEGKTVDMKFTFAVNNPNHTNISNLLFGFVLFHEDGNAGDQVDIGEIQVEAKPYATSFAHGDMGTGYSWQGTPHNSPTIRERSRVRVLADSDIPRPVGSVYYRFAVDPALQGKRDVYLGAIGAIGVGTQHQMNTYIEDSDNTFRGRAGGVNKSTAPATPFGMPTRHYMEWDGINAAFDYGDGAGKRYSTVNFDPDTNWNGGGLSLGDSGYGDHPTWIYPINGPAGCMILFDRILTPQEINYLDTIPTSKLTWDSITQPQMLTKIDDKLVFTEANTKKDDIVAPVSPLSQ